MDPHLRVDPEDGLASLAEVARRIRLKSARSLLIFVGVTTIFFPGIAVLVLPTVIDRDIQREVELLESQGELIDYAAVDEVRDQEVRAIQLSMGLYILLGVVFLVLASQVNRYPVVSTVTGLVLLLGAWAIDAPEDMTGFFQTLPVRIFFVALLVNAIRAALACRGEQPSSPTSFGAGLT